MTIDIKELKRLARKVAELEDQPEIAEEHAEAADALWLHMHCHTILGLIEEIERRDENPNFRAVQSARQEAERLKVENDALRSAAVAAREFIMHEAEVRGLLDECGQVSNRHPRRLAAIARIDAAMAQERC